MLWRKKAEHPPLTTAVKKELENYLFRENIQRSRLFAKIVIVFELILILMNVMDSYATHRTIFHFNTYLALYLFLFMMSIVMLIFLSFAEKRHQMAPAKWNWYRYGLLSMVSLFLIWGAVVTLVDQRTYGHVMAFAVNFMCVSILFHASNKVMLSIYAAPIAVLVIGLPFFQPSPDILFGHYVNLAVFLFFCWLASRMLYRSHSTSFVNQLLLVEANKSLARKVEENERMTEQLRQLAILDELTGIPNRRGFQEYLEVALHSRGTKQQLTIMMIDIDAFKPYNDNYGHVQGDQTLQQVAAILKNCTDDSNSICARFGGEEFIVAAFDMNKDQVLALAERISHEVEIQRIPHEYSPIASFITVSIGLTCEWVKPQGEWTSLIERADQALYDAKTFGRNLVCVYEEKNKHKWREEVVQ